METLALLLFAAALGVLIHTRTNTLLVYFQQEEYDAARFFTAWKTIRLFDVTATAAFLVAYLLGALWDSRTATLLLAAAAFAAIAVRERGYRYKKPLVATERLKRIRWVAWAMLALGWALCLALIETTPLAVQAVPLAIAAANALLAPLQDQINQRFIEEARAKIDESPAIRIGVTGSFGKTTVKHILADLLELGGPVFYSRGSINTELGLTRHVRQRLQPAHRYFIAEMGAYYIGSIARLCRFVRPTYGIITAIGDAHAERFGGIDATARAKSELADWVCRHGEKVVITEQVLGHKPFADLRDAHPEKFVIVGESDAADVRVLDATLAEGRWTIQLALPGRAETLTFSIPLLGAHNVSNAAVAVAMAHTLDAELVNRAPSVTKTTEQVPHRLELKERPGQPLILDDAFNSNETGFRNAVDVLRRIADEKGGQAIIVTPGIVELGTEHDRVHRSLGALCASSCDVVLSVNGERMPSFVESVSAGPARHIACASLKEAQAQVNALKLGETDVVLYENDLPDMLEETRVL